MKMKIVIKSIVVVVGMWIHNIAFAACIPFDGVNPEITASGEYCLTKDIAWDLDRSRPIKIEADNVVFDMQNHIISAQPSTNGIYTQGIWGSGKNITVKNGSVMGFDGGIDLTNMNADGDVIVLNMLVSSSVYKDRRSKGIDVHGPRVVVKNNVIENLAGQNVRAIEAWGVDETYGGTLIIENNRIMTIRSRSEFDPVADVFGIFARRAGNNSSIRNNVIADMQSGPGGDAVGISFWSSEINIAGASIVNNQVFNPVGIKRSVGIEFLTNQTTGQPTQILNNDINFFNTGIYTGLYGTVPPVISKNVVRNATTKAKEKSKN
jgi:hypothetical protein